MVQQVSACTTCAPFLPHGVRPVLQIHPDARILIAGQAPGRRVHESGIPFDDASGNRLRSWMGINKEVFYNPHKIAILPMGFCFPGSRKSGDLAPRPECAPQWRSVLLGQLSNIQLTIVLGSHALKYHLPEEKGTLTRAVLNWEQHFPFMLPLPHPSPRNIAWFQKNSWFEHKVLPALKIRVHQVLNTL